LSRSGGTGELCQGGAVLGGGNRGCEQARRKNFVKRFHIPPLVLCQRDASRDALLFVAARNLSSCRFRKSLRRRAAVHAAAPAAVTLTMTNACRIAIENAGAGSRSPYCRTMSSSEIVRIGADALGCASASRGKIAMAVTSNGPAKPMRYRSSGAYPKS